MHTLFFFFLCRLDRPSRGLQPREALGGARVGEARGRHQPVRGRRGAEGDTPARCGKGRTPAGQEKNDLSNWIGHDVRALYVGTADAQGLNALVNVWNSSIYLAPLSEYMMCANILCLCHIISAKKTT